MRNVNQIKQPKCMGCGLPISSGFFCVKCVELGAVEQAKPDGWKGTRFTEDRKKRVRSQMLRDDLTLWGKRIFVSALAAVAFLGCWKAFGDRIQTEVHEAASVFRPGDRTDPTDAHPIQLDSKGNPVGTTPFSGQHNR